MIYTQSVLCCHIYLIEATLQAHCFVGTTSHPSPTTKFINNVRIALLRAKFPAGHSFRIDTAITAVSAGTEDSTIQTLAHWQGSSCLLYIKLDPCHMASLSSSLAKCPIWSIAKSDVNLVMRCLYTICRNFSVIPLLVYYLIQTCIWHAVIVVFKLQFLLLWMMD